MTRKEACQRLELNMEATEADAKKAYFKLIRKYTPERNPAEFAKIREAYDAFQQGFKEEDQKTDPLDSFPQPRKETAQQILESAIRLANMGADEKSVEITFRSADVIEPDNPRVLGNWTRYYLNIDHPGKAAKIADRLIKVCPDSGEAYRMHMLACKDRGWHKKAISSGHKAYARGCRDEYFLNHYFELLMQQDLEREAAEIAPIIFEHAIQRKNIKDPLIFLGSWADALHFSGTDATLFFDKLTEFTRQNAMRLSNTHELRYLIDRIGTLSGYLNRFDASDFNRLNEWLNVLTNNIRDEEFRDLAEVNRIEMLGNSLENDSRRLDYIWLDCVGILQMRHQKMEAQMIRFAELDLQLRMIARGQKSLDEIAIVKDEYPMLYSAMPQFFEELGQTEDTQAMMDARLRDYQKLKKYYSGGRFEEEYPELMRLPNEPKMVHSEWDGTYVREGAKIGRNDPCPCGSGKKYKNCCMNKSA